MFTFWSFRRDVLEYLRIWIYVCVGLCQKNRSEVSHEIVLRLFMCLVQSDQRRPHTWVQSTPKRLTYSMRENKLF